MSPHSLTAQSSSTQSVCDCVFVCTHRACLQGCQIRLACYEALVRTDIWPKCCAAEMLSRISENDAKQRENREKRNRNKPTRPTVTHSRLLHCSFGEIFPLSDFLSLDCSLPLVKVRPLFYSIYLHFSHSIFLLYLSFFLETGEISSMNSFIRCYQWEET